MTSIVNGQTSLGHGYYLEDLAPDMEASVSKTITDEDIKAFAELSGDVNPVHIDDEFASGTIFKKRIAHGFLTGALFSTVLGTKLPGPGTIYLSQSMQFRGPVALGDTVTVTVRAAEKDPAKHRIVFDCIVTNQRGETVISGEAKVIAPTEKISRVRVRLPDVEIHEDQPGA